MVGQRSPLVSLAAFFLCASTALAAGAPAAVAFRGAEGRAEVVVRGAKGQTAGVTNVSPTEFVVHVPGARAARRIDRLPIDASAFDGPVVRVRVQPVAGGLDVRVTCRQPNHTTEVVAAEGEVRIEVVAGDVGRAVGGASPSEE
jgi:hypothetical protein